MRGLAALSGGGGHHLHQIRTQDDCRDRSAENVVSRADQGRQPTRSFLSIDLAISEYSRTADASKDHAYINDGDALPQNALHASSSLDTPNTLTTTDRALALECRQTPLLARGHVATLSEEEKLYGPEKENSITSSGTTRITAPEPARQERPNPAFLHPEVISARGNYISPNGLPDRTSLSQ